jgi:hypothetical protein
MNANHSQFATSASFAVAANAVRVQAAVKGATTMVSHLKRKWHSLHAWTIAQIESLSMCSPRVLLEGLTGTSLPEGCYQAIAIPCPAASRRYGMAEPGRSVGPVPVGVGRHTDRTGSVDRRGFGQRLVSHR